MIYVTGDSHSHTLGMINNIDNTPYYENNTVYLDRKYITINEKIKQVSGGWSHIAVLCTE